MNAELFALFDDFPEAPTPRVFHETVTEHVAVDSMDAFLRPGKQYAIVGRVRRMLSTRDRANVWHAVRNVSDMIFWARQSPAHNTAMLRAWDAVHDELAQLGRGWEFFDPPISVWWAQLTTELKALLEGPYNAEATFAWIGRAKLLVINACNFEEGWDAP